MTVTGAVNNVQSTSDFFVLTGVTILPGTEVLASSMARPYGDELPICQRYYERIGMTVYTAATYNNTSWFKATKRLTPTITLAAGALNGATVGALTFQPAGRHTTGQRRVDCLGRCNLPSIRGCDGRVSAHGNR